MINIPKSFPLHLQPRSDSEIRENSKFQLSLVVRLPQEYWPLASRGSYPGQNDVDLLLSPPLAIAVICQTVWSQPHRVYDRNDARRLAFTRGDYGGIVRRKLIMKTVSVGVLDYRELQHRASGNADCFDVLIMDLIDQWGRESIDYQRALISQMARS
jgi:hypothetical protein